MKRRSFLKATIALSAAAGASIVPVSARAAASAPAKKQEYYEFRAYRLKAGANAEALHQYLKDAAIPALKKKLGAGPIGVFIEVEPKDPATVYVLVPYPSLESLSKGTQLLKLDDQARKAAPAYADAKKESPGFDRIDSWVLLAFEGMPRVELAEYSKKRSNRIFELRTYESYSEVKAAKKDAMFNDGEMDIMREVGLAPVFFGEALAGPNLPHLTYMTSGENMEEHKKHWDAFVKHPKWDQMKNDPQYADTVSKITKWMLKPTDYSEI